MKTVNILVKGKETFMDYTVTNSVLESIPNDPFFFFRIFGLHSRQTGPISHHLSLNFPKGIFSRYQFSVQLIFDHPFDMYINFPEIFEKTEEPRTKKLLFNKKKKKKSQLT